MLLTWTPAFFAAAFHVLAFSMESLRWTTPAVRRVFRQTPEQAQTTRVLAYNQGFYNLFLAIGTAVGIAMTPSDRHSGIALVVLGVGSMLAAALVLVSSDPSKARGAVVQGTIPLLTLLALAVWAWT